MFRIRIMYSQMEKNKEHEWGLGIFIGLGLRAYARKALRLQILYLARSTREQQPGKLNGVCRNKGLYSIGIIYPYSLLRTSTNIYPI